MSTNYFPVKAKVLFPLVCLCNPTDSALDLPSAYPTPAEVSTSTRLFCLDTYLHKNNLTQLFVLLEFLFAITNAGSFISWSIYFYFCCIFISN